MSDSNIITKEAQVDTINKITKDQSNMVDACIDALKDIKDGKTIDESTVRNLTSVMRELDSLRELFYIRLFNSLKRGDMLLGQITSTKKESRLNKAVPEPTVANLWEKVKVCVEDSAKVKGA